MSEDTEFQPKVYRCHRYFFTGARRVAGFFLSLIGLSWLLPLATLLTHGAIAGYPLMLAVYMSFTLACIYFLVNTVHRVIVQTGYVVNEEALVFVGLTRKKVVPFAEVTAVRRGFPGGVVVRSTLGLVRLPPIIANLPGLIDDVRDGLARVGNASVLDASTMDALRQSAVVNEWSTKRLFRMIGRTWRVAELMLVAGLVAANLFWQWPFFLSLSWALLSMVVPITVMAAADMILSKRARATLRTGGSLQDVDESAALVGAAAIGLTLYLSAGIAARIWIDILVGRR